MLDRAGCIQYIDIHDIDDQPDNEEVFKVLRQLEPEAARRLDEAEKKAPHVERQPGKGIIMYCTSWCPDCKKARRWFDERGLEIEEVNVNEDREAARKVREWANGNLTTPTFDIYGTILVDYDEQKLHEILKDRLESK